MDEKPDQIAQHIESKRTELGRNLDELQNRVRDTTDWRRQFDRHPYILMGAALGGGMLLSSMVGGSSSSSYSGSRSRGSRKRSFSSEDMPHTSSYYMNQGQGSSAWPAHQDEHVSSFRSSLMGSGMGSSSYNPQRQRAWGMLENIKTALFGLAATRAQEYLNDMLPGFREHFQEAQGRGGQQQAGFMGQPGQQGQQGHQQNWGQQGQGQHQWEPGQQQHQPWNLGQQGQQRWGEHPEMGRSFNQPEHRWSGQQETWRQPNAGQQHQPNQGQWPQERNWEREREGQGSFRR